MDIPIGSKWVRVKVDNPTQERFIGQEVEVVPTPGDWGHHRVWIKRKCRDGKWDIPRHLSREGFVHEFEPLVTNLENK